MAGLRRERAVQAHHIAARQQLGDHAHGPAGRHGADDGRATALYLSPQGAALAATPLPADGSAADKLTLARELVAGNNLPRKLAITHDDRVSFVLDDSLRLTGIQILDPEGETRTLPVEMLLVLQGLSPKLGPVTQWGLDIERKQLLVDTEAFSTSVPGIFAVGDINTYPGKKKLILCGFHEATLAAFGALALLRPEEKTLLQYTTTSTELHRLLGLV